MPLSLTPFKSCFALRRPDMTVHRARASYDEARSWANQGNIVGLPAPTTQLGVAAFDVDGGDYRQLLNTLKAEGIFSRGYPSKRIGGQHLFTKTTWGGAIRKWRWRGAYGELFTNTGAITLHNFDRAIDAIAEVIESDCRGINDFFVNTVCIGPTPVPLRWEESDWAIGNRNNQLNAIVFYATLCGRDDETARAIKLARAARLPESEIADVISKTRDTAIRRLHEAHALVKKSVPLGSGLQKTLALMLALSNYDRICGTATGRLATGRGCSRKTIQRHQRILQDAGYIVRVVESTRRNKHGRAIVAYQVRLPHQNA